MPRHCIEAVLDRIEITESCWLWHGAITAGGYGTFRRTTAHRIAYEWWVGAIPERYTIDHLCRVRNCVNPDHLEAVPHSVNIRRGDHANNTGMCVRGHPFDDANTYWYRGWRFCRRCHVESERRRKARHVFTV